MPPFRPDRRTIPARRPLTQLALTPTTADLSARVGRWRAREAQPIPRPAFVELPHRRSRVVDVVCAAGAAGLAIMTCAGVAAAAIAGRL